ncbi:MAG: TonB-dependent receptor [Sphingobium sp.]
MHCAFSRFTNPSKAALFLATTMLTMSGTAFAQESDSARDSNAAADSGVIIVTAQKRAENLQDVPIAIVAMNSEKLDQLQVQKFEDYARFLPSVSFQNTNGPGTSKVYFRGVANGENANASGSQPSVGIYLDEQPVTTIQGALDIHVYDIARVEALAGPQGTLYGAASQAGTLRIITNKPNLDKFEAGANVELNTVAHGSQGYVGEGFVNAPLNDKMAVRVVGWYKKDAGYIDNIPGSLTFPTSGVTIDNDQYAKDDYNDVVTYGGRAALKIDLNDDWTVTPQIMGQRQRAHGSFGSESGLGDLQTMQFAKELATDKWFQASLTVEGKIGTWDVTYAGAYMKRKVDTFADYVDYSYFYDALYGYGAYFVDNDGAYISPQQKIHNIDRYTQQSHELRLASPSSEPVRFIGGLFYQRQKDNIENDYTVDGLADSLVVPGTVSNIWKTAQNRIDRDYAAFGEISADPTDHVTFTMGTRLYKYDNSLVGFAGMGGFGDLFGYPGVSTCFGPSTVKDAPCTNVKGRQKETGLLHKFNLTYKFNRDALVYATLSRGYRPGGTNRIASLGGYQADFIENLEFGWKTSWLDNRLHINGAIYNLDWSDVQLSTLTPNGITRIQNVGKARVRGAELEIWTRPAEGLTISGSMAYNDAKLREDYCLTDCAVDLQAPKGTRLPVSAKFKANAVARYEFPVGDAAKAHVQTSVVYEGSRKTDLRTFEQSVKGSLGAYTMVDASAGIDFGIWSAEIFATNLFDKRSYSAVSLQCLEVTCGDPYGLSPIGAKMYRTAMKPRMLGVRLGVKY